MSTFFNRCGGYRENLCLLASGVLPDAERSALEDHLASCANCKNYYNTIKSTARTLADWEGAFVHVGPNQKMEERWAKDFQTAIEPVRSRPATLIFSVFDWCHDMIWPCRRIWAGFAVVWLGVLAVDISMRDNALTLAMKSSRPPAGMVKAFLESEGRRVEFEWGKPGENGATPPTKQFSPPSRSEWPEGNLRG
jgi:anti-sigma factor RsiW